MSGRTYLSIGDVLTLLRQEFPDVTISKIRFLESQGLVNPERTPSGYRKFYEPDVERLRWVLRQQREHFLPLKVIKGRLEQESDGDVFVDEDVLADGDALSDGYGGWSDDDLDADIAPEPALVGRRAVPDTEEVAARHSGSAPVGALPGFEAASPIIRTSTGGTEASTSSSSVSVPGLSSATHPARTSRSAVERGARQGSESGDARVRGSGAQKPRSEPAPVASPTPPGSTRRPPAAAPSPGTTRATDSRRHPAAQSVPADVVPAEPVAPSGDLSGVSMTLEEIASSSGLGAADVRELESYGLLAGKMVGGVAYYDEDALAVARMAAGFAEYGVEARHLRLHKNAADREAGFIEQIVLPMFKQRNPEARQRAHDTVAELTRLGQGLRSVLVRSSLRNQLGG